MKSSGIAKIAKKNASTPEGMKFRSEWAFKKLAREDAEGRELCTRWNNIHGVHKEDERWKAAAAKDEEFMKLYWMVVLAVDIRFKRENLKAFLSAWPAMKDRIGKAAKA